MASPGPNWAEQVTAIATAVGAIGLLGAIGAAVFASQQVVEARRNRQAALAAEFFRRWDDADLVETRRLVGQFKSKDDLASAFRRYIAENSMEAFILYRELDYFEQLAALESVGAFNLDLIKLLIGRILVDRWEMWRPALREAHGEGVYPQFEALARRLRSELGGAA
jgi:hypothetical protein